VSPAQAGHSTTAAPQDHRPDPSTTSSDSADSRNPTAAAAAEAVEPQRIDVSLRPDGQLPVRSLLPALDAAQDPPSPESPEPVDRIAGTQDAVAVNVCGLGPACVRCSRVGVSDVLLLASGIFGDAPPSLFLPEAHRGLDELAEASLAAHAARNEQPVRVHYDGSFVSNMQSKINQAIVSRWLHIFFEGLHRGDFTANMFVLLDDIRLHSLEMQDLMADALKPLTTSTWTITLCVKKCALRSAARCVGLVLHEVGTSVELYKLPVCSAHAHLEFWSEYHAALAAARFAPVVKLEPAVP
jgi:hypothetical protein